MKNILVNVTNLKPGDTWLESDGYVYVVFAITPEGESCTIMSAISVKGDQVKTTHALYGNSATLVVDRPNPRKTAAV